MLHINSGHRLSKQYHNVKEETIYVLRGVLHFFDENDVLTRYVQGDSIHIKPGQVHRFAAWDMAPVELMEVSTTELDDVVRIEDDYERS